MPHVIDEARILLTAWLLAVGVSSSAAAPEVFAGVYAHEVDTPFTLHTDEDGMDLVTGYRFPPIEELRAIGRPAPYVIASLNTEGDTSFIGGGLSWKLVSSRWYLRPALALVVHDGPARYVSRMIRLAWLSPAVLEKLVLERCPPTVSIKDLAAAAELPWSEQEAAVFG